MLKILIADDHPLLRAGLAQILRDALPVGSITEVSSGEEAVAVAQRVPLDLVILDISLPGKSGIVVLGELKEALPHLPVLILSIQSESQYASRALRLGASGCLNKAIAPEELVNAVKIVLRGETYLTPASSSALINALRAPSKEEPHTTLSERETQVMIAIASGKCVGEIAEELGLSAKTISTYRTRLLEKMQLANNAQLTHYVYQHHLL